MCSFNIIPVRITYIISNYTVYYLYLYCTIIGIIEIIIEIINNTILINSACLLDAKSKTNTV